MTYKALYKFLDDGVHGEVLDFAGAITSGKDLDEARHFLAEALFDMAETNLYFGESLPITDLSVTSGEADLEEPIHLIREAAQKKVKITPEPAYEAA